MAYTWRLKKVLCELLMVPKAINENTKPFLSIVKNTSEIPSFGVTFEYHQEIFRTTHSNLLNNACYFCISIPDLVAGPEYFALHHDT